MPFINQLLFPLFGDPSWEYISPQRSLIKGMDSFVAFVPFCCPVCFKSPLRRKNKEGKTHLEGKQIVFEVQPFIGKKNRGILGLGINCLLWANQ